MTIVDDEDFERLSKFLWCVKESVGVRANKYYVVRREPGTQNGYKLLMHHEILNVEQGVVRVDHRNGNGLDNRRQNLRVATDQQNAFNQGIKQIPSKLSAFKGVSRMPQPGRWRAYIVKDNKQKHLGCFDSEERAALAYNIAAAKMFGEFARLNDL